MNRRWIARGILTTGCLCVAISWSPSQLCADTPPEAAKPTRFSVECDGKKQEYFIRLPRDYDPVRSYWALVVVHGGGGNGRTHWLSNDVHAEVLERDLPAIVISPSFDLSDANAQRFPILGGGAFLRCVLDDARGRYQLHPKILVTGYSRGGQFTHRFALENPSLVHACAPFSAGSWTTPDGRFLMYGQGEVENPERFLSTPENGQGLIKNQQNLFEPRVARVATQNASPSAKQIPFLVMCGSLDERSEPTKEFSVILKNLGYTVATAWPKTPHGGRNNGKYQSEFKKYSRTTVAFFEQMTRKD